MKCLICCSKSVLNIIWGGNVMAWPWGLNVKTPFWYHVILIDSFSSLYHQNPSNPYYCCMSIPCLQFWPVYLCIYSISWSNWEFNQLNVDICPCDLEEKHCSVGFIEALELQLGLMLAVGHQFNPRQSNGATSKRLHSDYHRFHEASCQMGACEYL